MANPLQILNIEDSEDDTLLLAREFRRASLEARLTRVDTEAGLRAALAGQEWDLVLCDYSMPHFGGILALNTVRELAPDLPVILVSGTVGEDVAVEAMRAGANDYLMKDNLRRLIPAVERELRDAAARLARKRAEAERAQLLRFFESVDRVSRAMQGSHDLEQVMSDVLDTALAIFGCDRAWLVCPCDPDAASWRVTMERTRPEYPGALPSGEEFPVTPEAAEVFRAAHAATEPVTFGPESEPPLPPELARRFGMRSQIAVELHPKGGQPYLFGLHQCSAPRVWTVDERKLFLEVGRRLTDALTSLLVYRELQEREAGLQLALDAGRLGEWRWNISSGELLWSARCKALYGLPPNSPVDLDLFRSLLCPEDRQRIPAVLKQAVETGADYEMEKRLVWPDGTEHWQVSRGRVFRDATGKPLHMTGVTMDITDRKLGEEALRRSERTKTVLSQIAGIFLSVRDDQMYGRVLRVVLQEVESRLGLFGFIAENGDLVLPSISGEVWDQCRVTGKSTAFPPSTWGDSLWGKAIRERCTVLSEGPFHTPSGHLGIERFLSVPIVFGEETIGLISVANAPRQYTAEHRDILESIAGYISPILNARLQRDRQEEKRRCAEDTLRKLSRAVEQSPVSIMITDAAGNIEYVNPKFSEVTGYAAAEVLGANPRLLKSGELPAVEYQRLWQTIVSGKEWRGEFHNRKKNGELYWELASISPVFDAQGAITHFLAVKEDVTQRKRLEEEFRQAQKLEAVGQLAGGVAHDFNNILAAVLLNLSLLKRDAAAFPEIALGLEELQHEVQRAVSLTRQLLMFSRRQVLDTRPLHLGEVVNNMAKMLRRLIGEDIELIFPGQCPDPWVVADPGMMDQVLLNLCVNARDAMPQGGRLTIDTRRVVVDAESAQGNPEVRPGVFVCLSVADTGCGMDDRTLKHIFEPFFTTKEAGKGTGLGLATVYGIVKQHQGWIAVESALEKGSTFRVFLPAWSETAEDRTSVPTAEIRGGNETLLLVEDDRALRRLAALSLRGLGYAVLEAGNGPDALRIWEQQQPRIDLLLTDMVLPGGFTGVELAERFRKSKPTLRVVVTSGYSSEKSRSDLLPGKGFFFLTKPYDAASLAAAVRSLLDRTPPC